ncbi:MAG: hypothetical protein SFX18_04045 [Pirellulales bacterium]|nr:hypothetical protein [Pirellulales bacterium]
MSGSRVELGLVLFGTLALALMTACLAVVAAPPIAPSGSSGLWQTLLQMAQSQAPTIICLVIIGLVSGLYIVPLYTLLQHRAPKDSKGNMVATSNFLNVTGGLIAVASFYCVTLLLQSWTGNSLTAGAVEESHDPAVWRAFVTQLEAQQSIPQRLFLTASGFTLLMFALMSWMRPDFLSRTLSYLLMPLRRRLEVDHADFVPSYGPLLVVSNASSLTEWLCIVSAIDRKLCFMWQPTAADQGMLATLVQATGIGRALPATSDDLPQFLEKSLVLADERELLWGVTAPGEAGTHSPASDWSRILSTLQDSLVKNQLADRWRILPVLARNFSPAPDRQSTIPAISVGHPLPVTATASEIAAVLGQLATH